MLSTAGTPVSYALTGPVSSALGAQATLVGAGAVGAAVVILAAVLIPGARAPERDGSLEPASAPGVTVPAPAPGVSPGRSGS
jgi:hypothetical protein